MTKTKADQLWAEAKKLLRDQKSKRKKDRTRTRVNETITRRKGAGPNNG